MDLTGTKLAVAALFTLLRLFFGILPVKLHHFLRKWEDEEETDHFINEKRHRQVTCFLALSQSFGGGVLFATAFLHMMPEVYFSMENLKKYGNLKTDFPLSQMTVSCGFFLVYFVEEFAQWFVTKLPEEPCVRSQNHHNNNLGNRIISPLVKNKVSPVKEKSNEKIFYIESHEKFENMSVNSDVLKENLKNLEQGGDDDDNAENGEMKDEEVEVNLEVVEDTFEQEVKDKQKFVRYILMVLALSLHAIFEGLAIGLQSSTATIWYLFTAVSIHSATILFYISLEMILAKTKMKIIIINIIVLALTSPSGVLLGLLITLKTDMNTKAKSTAVVLLEGLSAGTILYITFFEVLNREKERRIYRFRRGLCILGGFAFMAILQCVELHAE